MKQRKHKLFGKAIKARRNREWCIKRAAHYSALLKNLGEIFKRLEVLAASCCFHTLELNPMPYRCLVVLYATKIIHGKKYYAAMDVTRFNPEPSDDELNSALYLLNAAFKRREDNPEEIEQ